ncbi:MAG: putative CRISPR-associated protein [Planctomycetes bacterium]|nr:putative CRISPR-associated protein [Planctomycetota bacterium]
MKSFDDVERPSDINENDIDAITKHIKEVERILNDRTLLNNLDQLKKDSAEFRSLIALKRRSRWESQDGQNFIQLIHTDTWFGKELSRILKPWITREFKCNSDALSFSGLRTSNIETFQESLSNIVKWCSEALPGYKESGYRIIFNLTGGFKSIQGFLQTLAMFYADETVYIFETSDELLSLPKLPIDIDKEARQIIENNLAAFRRLSKELQPESAVTLPETLVQEFEGHFILTAWGSIVWEKAKSKIYQRQVWPSPCKKVRYGNGFEASVNSIPDLRKAMINERIDDLMVYLESDRRNCPKRLDFKQLKGKPVNGCTYEMDAWADGDAKRLFGRFDESDRSVFIIEKLGEHL